MMASADQILTMESIRAMGFEPMSDAADAGAESAASRKMGTGDELADELAEVMRTLTE